MKPIKSFCIDHDVLERGLYVSRTDGDVITYDIRTRKPNMGDYMTNAAMHTVEHLFATYIRNSTHADKVIYFGPMGCRTGFYLLLRDAIKADDVITLVCDTFRFILDFEGTIPGGTKKECGNYLEHDLAAAKAEAQAMLSVLQNWSEAALTYPKGDDCLG